MPNTEDNDAAVKGIAKAIISEMKGAGFCFIKDKEWKEVRRTIVALGEEMAHNSVAIQDIHDILNANSRRKR